MLEPSLCTRTNPYSTAPFQSQFSYGLPSHNSFHLSYIFTGSCYPHPAMTGLVGLSARQPPSSILGPGKDTREPLETAIEPDDTQAMSPQMTSEEVEALKREMHTEL